MTRGFRDTYANIAGAAQKKRDSGRLRRASERSRSARAVLRPVTWPFTDSSITSQFPSPRDLARAIAVYVLPQR